MGVAPRRLTTESGILAAFADSGAEILGQNTSVLRVVTRVCGTDVSKGGSPDACRIPTNLILRLSEFLDMSKLRLIAGSGRSGTTWVLDSMADAGELRPVFEPLHPSDSDTGREHAHTYLTRYDERPALRQFLFELSEQGSRSSWTSYRILGADLMRFRPFSARRIAKTVRRWQNLLHRAWQYRERERREEAIIKCIRANLMLDWISHHFDANIVLLLRHPCAVVESQLRFSEAWDPYSRLEVYRTDLQLMSGALKDFHDQLHTKMSHAEALAAIWCIETLIPLSQAASNGYEVVHYEELLENQETEWERVAAGLGIDQIPNHEVTSAPSQQAAVRLRNDTSESSDYAASYAKWRKRLDQRSLDEIQGILQTFGIKNYDVNSDRPVLTAETFSAHNSASGKLQNEPVAAPNNLQQSI